MERAMKIAHPRIFYPFFAALIPVFIPPSVKVRAAGEIFDLRIVI
jgi:hypothetical protein